MKVKVKSRRLKSSSILYFKLIWIDYVQNITALRIVQWQNIIYIIEKDWIQGFRNIWRKSASSVWRNKSVSSIAQLIPNWTNMLWIKNVRCGWFHPVYCCIWVDFDKVRLISTNNRILPSLLSVLLCQATLNHLSGNFSCTCGMVVYKVEKSNVLTLLQMYWDLELKF